jgi:hypothetical protein
METWQGPTCTASAIKKPAADYGKNGADFKRGTIMIRLSKSVLALGGVVLAGGLITVMNPQTVHAVAAALVQVTNTASNPVVAQEIDKQAGNMVRLTCSVTLSGALFTCTRFAPDGSTTFHYTVPAGESLVITAIDVLPTTPPVCPGNYFITLGTPNELGVYATVETTNAQVTTHFTYPSGLAIGEGISPTWEGFGFTSTLGVSCPGSELVDMFGYLTAA